MTLNNKLGLENPTHSESCVGQVAEKEEDTESEVRLGNDQQPIKLQNSQILNDLGTKLSHLPLVQRKELAEVITQYREVFPDVPSKTNLIEHDVDVGDSAHIKQHPYRVSPMKKELLDKEVQYMLKNNIIEESQSNWSSPCILVPKHDIGFRFCTDFRKVNDKTKSEFISHTQNRRLHRSNWQCQVCQHVLYAERLLAGTFNSASSRNFRVCNTKGFISVHDYAFWNEKSSSNIPKNG